MIQSKLPQFGWKFFGRRTDNDVKWKFGRVSVCQNLGNNLISSGIEMYFSANRAVTASDGRRFGSCHVFFGMIYVA